jgi:hypothetical protein
VQGANCSKPSAWSSAHSNVTPARFEENVKLAERLSVSSSGPLSIVVFGGVPTVQV